MYTIGEISRMFGLPVSTIRYYDQKGLLPGIERQNGQRRFGSREVETLSVIHCLKQSGLSIDEIAQFMKLCEQGADTFEQRKNLFEERKKRLEEELEELRKTEALIDFKIWYYQQAIADQTEDTVRQRMETGDLPKEILQAYELGFGLPLHSRTEENS